MRLVGKEQKFADKSEKALHELGILKEELKVLTQKIDKLERFKTITFDPHDRARLEEKIARYETLKQEVTQTGNDYMKQYYEILDAEEELAREQLRLNRLKTGKLVYLNQNRETVKKELMQNIERLERSYKELLYY